MIVLHVQKVAGISGSEAHLLSLLPDLRERGWDIRFLMLHEHEPGAWEFARALEAGGGAGDALPIRAGPGPPPLCPVLGSPGRPPPPTPHTHPPHPDATG